MTNEPRNEAGHPGTTAGDTLARLFRQVPSRERPPEADERAIHDAVRAEWTASVRVRKRRVVAGLSAAAVAVLAVGALLIRAPGPQAAGAEVASIVRVDGPVRVEVGGDQRAAIPGLGVVDGARVVTGAGGWVVLRWAGGIEIRVAEHTELLARSRTDLRLSAGGVYVDTGPDDPGPDPAGPHRTAGDLEIETPHGTVRHIGTRYLAQVLSSRTDILVRSGRVRVRPGDSADGAESGEATTGERVTVAVGAPLRTGSVPTWGAQWSWADDLSPGFDADGQSVATLIDWVARETGRKVQYASSEVRAAAEMAMLHGEFALPPLEALAVAAATADLVAAVEDGVIHVRAADR